MTIRNSQEYQTALLKAASIMDTGFNGNIERERYYREILTALVDYELKNSGSPINQSFAIAIR
ncbi:MAG: hypothetical protein ACK4NY_12615 [Spirosomataceae bacterium]